MYYTKIHLSIKEGVKIRKCEDSLSSEIKSARKR
jgi:hypothetical protein